MRCSPMTASGGPEAFVEMHCTPFSSLVHLWCSILPCFRIQFPIVIHVAPRNTTSIRGPRSVGRQLPAVGSPLPAAWATSTPGYSGTRSRGALCRG
jgi:hypothetical protein